MTAIRKPVEIEYPESDGRPMAESDLHRDIMFDVINRLRERYASRKNVYVSGNLLVYYEEGRPQKCLAPDCMVVFGAPPGARLIFKTWEEGVFPTVVFEITSKSTQREDVRTKFQIYQNIWQVTELFMFDPTEEYLEPSLVGYRMSRGELKQLTPARGRLTSTELGITLERNGERLILRDAKNGKELLLPAEVDAEDARRKLRKTEKERDEAAAKQRESDKQREDAEAEVARLRAELTALRKKPKA